MAGHSLLAPSAAHRWLICTPSARLEEGLESSSKYAEEGTLAHLLGELMLKHNGKAPAKEMAKIRKHELYSAEMPGEVDKYVSYVLDKVKPESTLIVEQRLDLSFLAPDQGGTADSIVVTGNVLDITDLKYGKGVRVYADNNPQQMLYAAGALHMLDVLYDIDTIRICIHQPRLDHVSEWEISATDLREWVATVAIPAAEKAYKGEGDIIAGSHCKFCKIKAKCRALMEHSTDMAKFDFVPANELTDEELSEVMGVIDTFKDWANSVETYVREKLLSGEAFPGYKLVEGRSVRKIIDPVGLEAKCREMGLAPDMFLDVKLKGITEMEKLHGKKVFADLAAPFIAKPKGSPTLAPDDDPRPAYAETIFTDESAVM